MEIDPAVSLKPLQHAEDQRHCSDFPRRSCSFFSTLRLTLFLCVSLVFALGVLMVFSTTSADALDHDLDRSPHEVIFKHLAYAVVGIFLATAMDRIGYHAFLRWSPFLLGFTIFLLILVLVPGIGRVVNGSRRWLSFGGMSIQPSEFVKVVAPAYFIQKLLSGGGQPWSFLTFCRLVAAPAISIALIAVEPNNGTAGVIVLTLVALCLLTHIPIKYWVLPLAVAAAIGAMSAYHLPYVSGRLHSYLHPELDLRGKGHQPYQAKIAAGSGGMWGRGPGNGLQKLSYLPEAQNDYIAAIYAEEFGFAGIAFLLSVYAIIGSMGFCVGINASDLHGIYFAGAILFVFCFQVFLNLGVVSGLLPSTGLNLPFFSQGGSSLIANFMGMGLLFSIARKQGPNNKK